MRTHLIIVSLIGLVAVIWIHGNLQQERNRARTYQLEQEQSTAQLLKKAMPQADVEELEKLRKDTALRHPKDK